MENIDENTGAAGAAEDALIEAIRVKIVELDLTIHELSNKHSLYETGIVEKCVAIFDSNTRIYTARYHGDFSGGDILMTANDPEVKELQEKKKEILEQIQQVKALREKVAQGNEGLFSPERHQV